MSKNIIRNLIRSKIVSFFQIQRFAIALEDLESFVSVVKDIQTKTPVAFPVQGLVMRFSGKSDIYTSTAYKRDTVNIQFYLTKRTNEREDASASLAGYQTISQSLVISYYIKVVLISRW